MLKLFKLVKVNLISYFNFYKILNAKGITKLKELLKFLLIVGLFFLSGIYIYYFAKMSVKGLVLVQAEYVLLGEFFALSSVLSLFTTIFRVDSVLFNSSDYDMLVSMPISKRSIITSKMFSLYISNLFFTIVIMVPVLILYTKYVLVSEMFYLLYILSIVLIPLLPTVIAVLVGSLVSFVSSRFRIKKVMQFIFMLIIMVGSLLFSFKLQGTNEFDMASMGEGLLNIFNKIYPLTNTYMKMIINEEIFSIFIFVILPISVCGLVIILLSFYYTDIVCRIRGREIKRKYRVVHQESSQKKALVKKELKRFVSSPTYVMNSISGLIFLLILTLVIIFVPSEKFGVFLGGMDVQNLLLTKGPFLVGFSFMLSCTSSSSISLEGKNLWILKSMPVDFLTVLWGKVYMNFIVLEVSGILISLVLHILFQLGLLSFILWIITLTLYALFISLLGLIVNLHFPLLNWDSEVKVIKQSVATFVTLVLGMVVGFIPLVIKYQISTYSFIVSVDTVFLILILIFVLYLEKNGRKLFSRLES